MLRNRSRAVTKQPIMADQSSSLSSPTTQNPNNPNTNRTISSFLGSPRFFNGFFSPKTLCDAESSSAAVMSPTSILDTKQFPNFGSNPFGFDKNLIIPGKNFQEPKHQTADKFDSENGIALALVEEKPSDNICKPNNSRKVLFGTNLRIQIPPSTLSPNGSPESRGDYGIKTRNSQFPGTPNTATGFGSPRPSPSPLSLSEMELSEEYTRVICRGPNPKTTHIYDNCVVESCCGGVVGSPVLKEDHGPKSPCEKSFLSSCETCKKNLGHGRDIFMYRGEKAFCSEECRCQEMLLDGLMNS